ncbi:unnamed protein product [Schistocephalus solidus]|uniref:NTF2 domain-containing protein n=1 Tax=Schistocephalus solidus TaxID=70667 RepID=A0A183THI0_SCHSO|nr:unnamed protein product [Schistocephalus solidus]
MDLFQSPGSSQLHLPEHGVDAEDSGPLQDFPVRDPVLPSQIQYSAEAAEMKVIQLPGMVQVDGPCFRSVKECFQDDGIAHLQFVVQVNTVAILQGGLQPDEGLTVFGDPLCNLFFDSRVALLCASQISKVFHIFELSVVDIDSGSIVFCAGFSWCVTTVLAVMIVNPQLVQPAAKRSMLLCISSSVTVLRAQSSVKSKS